MIRLTTALDPYFIKLTSEHVLLIWSMAQSRIIPFTWWTWQTLVQQNHHAALSKFISTCVPYLHDCFAFSSEVPVMVSKFIRNFVDFPFKLKAHAEKFRLSMFYLSCQEHNGKTCTCICFLFNDLLFWICNLCPTTCRKKIKLTFFSELHHSPLSNYPCAGQIGFGYAF